MRGEIIKRGFSLSAMSVLQHLPLVTTGLSWVDGALYWWLRAPLQESLKCQTRTRTVPSGNDIPSVELGINS